MGARGRVSGFKEVLNSVLVGGKVHTCTRGRTYLVGGEVLHAARHLVGVADEVLLSQRLDPAADLARVRQRDGPMLLEEVSQVPVRRELNDHVQRTCRAKLHRVQ